MYCPSVLDQGQNSSLLPDVKAQCMKKNLILVCKYISTCANLFSFSIRAEDGEEEAIS